MKDLKESRISYNPTWGVRPTPKVEPMTTYDMFHEAALKYPDKTSVIFLDTRFTYQDLDKRIHQMASALVKMGVKAGDRVSTLLPNCHQHVITFLAVNRIGAILVPINVMYSGDELLYCIKDSGAKLIITLDLFYANVMEIKARTDLEKVVVSRIDDFLSAEIDMGVKVSYDETTLAFKEVITSEQKPQIPPVGFDFDDTMMILYTAGTTGTSKGVMLTHRNFIYNAANQAENFDMNENDINLVLFPMFHISGWLLGTICMFYVGGVTLLEPRFDAGRYLEIIDKYKATGFFAPPTVYVAFTNHPDFSKYDVSSLRLSGASGAPVPTALQDRWNNATSQELLNGYGLTETTAGAIVCLPNKKKLDSLGVPLGGEVKIVNAKGDVVPIGEPGEILFRGPQVAKGYWNKPEETASTFVDGWLHTGDIAKMDSNGFIYFVDREKDLIIASAYNISPAEVEGVLMKHPAVSEAGVIGVPDEYRGETVKAFVVLKDEYKAKVTQENILDFGKENMAAFKAPKFVEFIDELPKSPIQKILRKELREMEEKRRKAES